MTHKAIICEPPQTLEATSELRLSVTLALYGVTKHGSRQGQHLSGIRV